MNKYKPEGYFQYCRRYEISRNWLTNKEYKTVPTTFSTLNS